MKSRPVDTTDFVYRPARAVRVALAEFERRAAQVGVNWGVRPMDEYLIPMVPGDLVTVLARPGMGKTSLLLHLSRHIASRLTQNETAVYATWETLVEEYVGAAASASSGFTLEDIGRGTADLPAVRKAAIDLIDMGVTVLGRSMESPPGRNMTLNDVDVILHELAESGQRPVAVLLDYLQRIPNRPGLERGDSVTENLEQAKDLALSHRVPVVLAAQARREVDDQSGLRLPGLRDGQWTSNIEQTSDKVLAVTKPAAYMVAGSTIKQGGFKYTVDDSLLCIKPLKQRWGPANTVVWVLGFDPRTYSIYPAPVSGEQNQEKF